MATITIRLDEEVGRQLRTQAASKGRSLEEEARDILRRAVAGDAPDADLGRAIRARFAPLGGVDLDLPARAPGREPPDLG